MTPAATPVALRDARQPGSWWASSFLELARPGRALRDHGTYSCAPPPAGRSTTPTPPVEAWIARGRGRRWRGPTAARPAERAPGPRQAPGARSRDGTIPTL